MHFRLEHKHEATLKRLEIAYKNYDNVLYVSMDDLKLNFDRLQDAINISSLVRYDNLVFTADFEVLRDVR